MKEEFTPVKVRIRGMWIEIVLEDEEDYEKWADAFKNHFVTVLPQRFVTC